MGRAITLAVLALLLAAPAGAQTDDAALAERALNEHILPGFEGLNAAAEALDAAAEAACAGDGSMEAVEAAYAEAFDAWAGIQHIRFGPAEEDNNGFAIEFWPDTKGSTPRALAALVANEDPVVDDTAGFAEVSVAARGLMALDQLLFDPEAAPVEPGGYRCRLLVAAMSPVIATSARMRDRWRDPWGGFLTSAGEPRPGARGGRCRTCWPQWRGCRRCSRPCSSPRSARTMPGRSAMPSKASPAPPATSRRRSTSRWRRRRGGSTSRRCREP